MNGETLKSEWPYLAYAAMFEMRSHLSVIDGYVRMLELERFGPLTEKQLEVLKGLAGGARGVRAQMEKLEALGETEYREAAGTQSQSRKKDSVALGTVLLEVIADEAARHDEQTSVNLQPATGDDHVIGHRVLLKNALSGLMRCLLRTRPEAEMSVSVKLINRPDTWQRCIVIAEAGQIEEAVAVRAQELLPMAPSMGLSFDLPHAQRVLSAHGGQVRALPNGMFGAVVDLPRP